MNDLERQLVELNEALLKLHVGEKIDDKLLRRARTAVSGGKLVIDTGSGNDTVIINEVECNDVTPLPGPPGERGEKGDSGLPGETLKPVSNSVLVTGNYNALLSDYYIGVNSNSPVVITLPLDPLPCQSYVIKAEMSTPIGNREVTILPTLPNTIDGNTSYVINQPFEFVSLFF